MEEFKEFKKKQKFLKDESLHYPGLNDAALRSILTEKINLSATYFETLSNSRTVTDQDYQDIIKKELDLFEELDLDTEERERVCSYFEELMDIVGLESSGGHLNNFMYGF